MTADQIAASMRIEAARLRTDAERLERFAALLDGPVDERERERKAAPYGYKVDGTPRRKPAPSAATIAKSIKTRRAKARARRMPNFRELDEGRASLHVVSTLHPSERELADRELVHTTEAPAEAAAS